MRDDIERALNNRSNDLLPRLEQVIRMAYGLTADGKKYSPDEIAQQMDVARIRVRQLKDRALMQLKLIPEKPE